MRRDVYRTKIFKKWARRHVILVEIDFPREKPQPPELKQQNAKLKERYRVRGFPTMYLIDADGEIVSPEISRARTQSYSGDGISPPEHWIAAVERHLK